MQIRDRIRELRRVRAGDLIPSPKNWRKHPQRQQDALRGVLAEVGDVDALLGRETPAGVMLIDGHLRAETTPDMDVPVLILDVDEAEADKILATFDPLSAMADAGKLDDLLRSVETSSEAVAAMLEGIAKDAGCEWSQSGDVVEDEVPEPPADPVTKPGDLWLLGAHRLLCGNSSDQRDIMRLNPDRQWDVAVIDPPYDGSASLWLRWIMDPCIVFGQAKHIRLIPDALWRWERVISKKYRHRSASVQIDHRHAFVVQCGTVKTCPRDKNLTFGSIVEQECKREHDHQKPVSLLVEHLTHWTPPWKTVVDPFAGSGSTIIAAEQMGRSCHAMELDPGWCDVIVERWKSATGITPQLESAA